MFNNGDSVNLTCLAEGGPGNTIQWTFNGTLLNHQSSQLVLIPINASENGGYYTCTVINAAGSDSYNTAVFVYPTITVHPSDVFLANHTSQGILVCEASAFPFPDYNWVHVNGIVTPFASGLDTPTLILDATQYRQGSEGDYYCTATSNGVIVESERATVFGKSFIVNDACVPIFSS